MMLDKLKTLIEEFDELEKSFNHFCVNGDGNNKEALIEFERRFVKLKTSFREPLGYVTKLAVTHDDKSATAIKFRIASAIMKGEYVDSDDTHYEECSITAAEKFASATLNYKEFIGKRAVFREALSNVNAVIQDCMLYINLIKDKLK